MTEPEENSDRYKIRVRTRKQYIATSLSWTIFVALLFFSLAQWSHWLSPEGRGGYSYGYLCKNKLKQLGLALHNFHEQHGSLPSAFTVDEAGAPMHSWRTLILLYIEKDYLHEQYKFDEPWNSTHNKGLLQTVDVLRCSWEEEHEFVTDFFAIVGPSTVWPKQDSISFDEIKDGMSETIALIQLPHSDVPWSEPTDVVFDGTQLTLRGQPIEWPRETAREKTDWFWQPNLPETPVLLADGSVYSIRIGTPFDNLIPSFTPTDGDAFDKMLLRRPAPSSESARWMTLVILPFVLGTLLVMAWNLTFQRTDRLITLMLFQFAGFVFRGSTVEFYGRSRFTDLDAIVTSITLSLLCIAIGFIVFECVCLYSHYRQKNRH